jgi:fatty acid desaturase
MDTIELTPLFNTEQDARRLQATALFALALLYAHVALVVMAWLPAWSLLLSSPILIVRWMLATHELFHLRTEREVDPLTWLMPLLLTPLSIGYREHLVMHRGHHRLMATPEDPEYFQLRGNRFVGFLNALTAPEQVFFRWIAAHGVDAAFLLGAGLRCGLFVLLVWAMGPLFFWYWQPARLSHGSAFFSFFYLLHRRDAEFGVYPLRLAPAVSRIYAMFFGREALLATCHHDLHHAHPRVSALRLPQLRDSP